MFDLFLPLLLDEVAWRRWVWSFRSLSLFLCGPNRSQSDSVSLLLGGMNGFQCALLSTKHAEKGSFKGSCSFTRNSRTFWEADMMNKSKCWGFHVIKTSEKVLSWAALMFSLFFFIPRHEAISMYSSWWLLLSKRLFVIHLFPHHFQEQSLSRDDGVFYGSLTSR